MVPRSSDGDEAQPPASRTPGTPAKSRHPRPGTSTGKEERTSKSSAKDVAELKDYVRALAIVGSDSSKLTWDNRAAIG